MPPFASMLFHCILAGTEGNTNRLTVPRYSPGSVATTTETYPITITPSWMGPIISRTGVCRLGHSNQFYTLSACPHWRTSNDLTPKMIWNYILETWKTRNQHLHIHANLNLPNYWQAVITHYEQHHLLPPAAQEALYHQPLNTILELLAPQLQWWVQQGYKYFNQQLKAVKKKAALQMHDIETYFQLNSQQNDDLQKKLNIYSVISLRLLYTKKTHTGAVSHGLPRVVGDHCSTECLSENRCKCHAFVVQLASWQPWVVV